jgi:nucleoside-diphosphate-sugar epimerase
VSVAQAPGLAASRERSGAGTILFGGSGFLGSHILARRPSMVSVGRTPPPTDNPHIQVDDLADLSALSGVEFNRVVYAVGHSDRQGMDLGHGPSPFESHVFPLLQTLEQLQEHPIEKLVCFSTVLLYDGRRVKLPISEDAPIDPYRSRYVLSQHLAEEACRFYGRRLPIVNVRLSNLYGPSRRERFDVIWLLVRRLLDEGRAELASGEPERDFVYVDDAAEAVVQLLDSDFIGTVNLGTGTRTSIGEVAAVLERLSGGTITELGHPFDGQRELQCDISRLRRATGWEPRHSIEEGLRLTWETMKAWKQA